MDLKWLIIFILHFIAIDVFSNEQEYVEYHWHLSQFNDSILPDTNNQFHLSYREGIPSFNLSLEFYNWDCSGAWMLKDSVLILSFEDDIKVADALTIVDTEIFKLLSWTDSELILKRENDYLTFSKPNKLNQSSWSPISVFCILAFTLIMILLLIKFGLRMAKK